VNCPVFLSTNLTRSKVVVEPLVSIRRWKSCGRHDQLFTNLDDDMNDAY
jgi:hypothetical protein